MQRQTLWNDYYQFGGMNYQFGFGDYQFGNFSETTKIFPRKNLIVCDNTHRLATRNIVLILRKLSQQGLCCFFW